MTKVLDILDCQGARVGEYTIPEAVLEQEKGEQAVHDAVVAFLAGERAGTACTKTRGEVRGGGAKPTRQKGLGRARTGSSRSPVWTGGGVAFGPTPRDYSKKINKKVAKLALRRAFTDRVMAGEVVVVDKFELADRKTKSACAVLKNLSVDNGSVLLAVPEFEENTFFATNNLPDVLLQKAMSVNVYELLLYKTLLFTKEGLDAFVARLA